MRYLLTDDDQLYLFHLWDDYVSEMEQEEESGGEPAVRTEATSIYPVDQAEWYFEIQEYPVENFEHWYRQAIDYIEACNERYYNPED